MTVTVYVPEKDREHVENFQKWCELNERNPSYYFQKMVIEKSEEYKKHKRENRVKDEH